MNLQKYIQYRRAQLIATRSKLVAQANAGVTTGALMGFDRKAQAIGLLLDELENLLRWSELGEKDFIEPVTEEERRFWLRARDMGMEIPPEIRGQL